MEKQIKGYEDYTITDDGKVFSHKYNQIKQLNPYYTHNGYEIYTLYKNGIPARFLTHQLVAQAFLPNPYDFQQVNHKDENKLNNNVNNLEWCDAKYNDNYGTRSSRIANKIKKSVAQISLLTQEIINIYPSQRQAAIAININETAISKVINGHRESAGGYGWRRITEEEYINLLT